MLTPRRDKVVDKYQKIDVSSSIVHGRSGWLIYSFEDFIVKYKFEKDSNEPKKYPIASGATGLAFIEQPFAEGADRFVFRCTEIEIPDSCANDWYYNSISRMELMKAYRVGLRFVAKESKDVENLERGLKFHQTFARV